MTFWILFLSLEYKFFPVFIFFFFLKIYEIELAMFDHEKDHFWIYRKVRTQNHFQSTLLFTTNEL